MFSYKHKTNSYVIKASAFYFNQNNVLIYAYMQNIKTYNLNYIIAKTSKGVLVEKIIFFCANMVN